MGGFFAHRFFVCKNSINLIGWETNVMEAKRIINSENENELIKEKIQTIKKAGFGEVRVLIKNGVIYRILSTEDKLVEEK